MENSCERCYKVVQRQTWFVCGLTGFTMGYIFGRALGALIGLIASLVANFGIKASVRFTAQAVGEGYKAIEKEMKK